MTCFDKRFDSDDRGKWEKAVNAVQNLPDLCNLIITFEVSTANIGRCSLLDMG